MQVSPLALEKSIFRDYPQVVIKPETQSLSWEELVKMFNRIKNSSIVKVGQHIFLEPKKEEHFIRAVHLDGQKVIIAESVDEFGKPIYTIWKKMPKIEATEYYSKYITWYVLLTIKQITLGKHNYNIYFVRGTKEIVMVVRPIEDQTRYELYRLFDLVETERE